MPIILTGVINLLFNAADIIVVGNFASDTALAAVGAPVALINLIVNLIMGLSVGAGVCTARCFGSKDEKGVHEVVHTSMLTALIGGLIFGLIGFFFARTFLVWMDTPDNVIDQSSLYVQIYFIGVPFSVLYNFGAAILRSVGDAKRPLAFLIIAGVANIILNYIFVRFMHLDVAGVAIATVVSQIISCVLVVRHLMKTEDCHKFSIRKMRFYRDKFAQILLIGLPAGVQGSLFSISNVLIQSSINSFGDVVMSGNTAASNVEGFLTTAMNAFHQTALTFVGQHIGAKKEEKIKKIAILCVLCVTVIGAVCSTGAYLLGEPLLGLYSSGEKKAEIIAVGLIRMSINLTTHCFCGIMDVLSGLLRGLGKSITAMIISLISICGTRIVWVFTVFKWFKTLEAIYISYPVSWVISAVFQGIFFIVYYKKLMKSKKETQAP